MFKKQFSYKSSRTSSSAAFLALLTIMLIAVTITLAFYFNSDWASKFVGMSGKVDIEAVGSKGEGYKSIEDTVSSSNLTIKLDSGYSVLIPGMPIEIIANCKVKQSTTSPLLRARIDITLATMIGSAIGDDYIESDIINGEMTLKEYFQNEMKEIVSKDNDWFFHTDGYFYYVGEHGADQGLGENNVLEEIYVTDGDKNIDFLDEEIVFPTEVDETYSGLGFYVSITFEAIQNYIPDNNGTGTRIDNTIKNSQKIFGDFTTGVPTTPLSYFTTSIVNGKNTLSVNPNKTLPETVKLPEVDANGEPITHLSASVFKSNSQVRNVIIPSSYTSMDPKSFEYSSLYKLDMSESGITAIPNYAFWYTKLVSVKLPKNLVSIGNQPFAHTLISGVDLPETLESIGDAAFYNTQLTEIFIPKNVSFINGGTVFGAYLNSIIVDDENEYYYDLNGNALISYSGKLHIVARRTDLTSFTIPDHVTELLYYSLYNTFVTSLGIGKNVTIINSYALGNMLEEFIIDDENTSFSTDPVGALLSGDGKTFIYYPAGLEITSYSIPESVETIYGTSFTPNVLRNLHLGKNVKTISGDLDADLKLEYITVDPENPYFYSYDNRLLISTSGIAYKYAELNPATTITVPNSVIKIHSIVFYRSANLITIELPNGLLEIGHNAFAISLKLLNINIPSTVTKIGKDAFSSCISLQTISLSGSIVDGGIFVSCYELKSVIITSNVTQIGKDTFRTCRSLEYIEFQATTPPVFNSSDLFTDSKPGVVIYVPDSAVDAYKAVPQLSAYVDKILPVSEKP